MPNITIYCQRDPRWATVRIGNTRLPIGDWGCALTDVSTLLSWNGVVITPGQLAKIPGLFTSDGLINWGQLEKATKGAIKFQKRIGGRLPNGRYVFVRDDKAIKASIIGSPKTVVIIQVNYGKHWVAGLGVTPDGKDYIIGDPIDGKRKQLLKTYPNITGSAHLILA